MVQQGVGLGGAIRSGIESMPYNAMLGIRIVSMSGGRARGVLPARPQVGNHLGAVHSAAQFSLIEATGSAAVSSAFLDLLDTAVPLSQGADVTWRRPAHGDVVADAAVDPGAVARVRTELASAGRARFDVAVTLTDAEGAQSAEARLRWAIRVKG